MINIIVAMTQSGVIGKKGKLPWNIKDEINLFQKITNDSIVIMGRKTWESIPNEKKPLKNRINVILSKTMINNYNCKNDDNKYDKNFFVFKKIDDALNFAKKLKKDIFFIGGKEIYKESLNIADSLYISLIKKEYEGDVYFPKINFKDWKKELETEFDEFTFTKYVRLI